MEHEELTGRVIGAAYAVYRALGHGFLESVYENALLVELREHGVFVENQQDIKVYYNGHVVGDFTADLFVERAVIVELKAVRALHETHEVQLVNYLKATGINVGLLINFGEQRVDVKRKVRVLPPLTASVSVS
jgi:GxxExxY protein